MHVDFRTSLEELDDEQLLARATLREVNSAEARAAQSAFYQRHVRYLYGALKRREATLQRTAGVAVDDLVQETFQRAFQYARSYRPAEEADVDRKRQRTRAWLGRIAQNLVVDAIGRGTEVSASPLIEQVSCDDIDEPSPPSSPELRAVRRALDELTDREQDVLRVTALYQRVGADNQRLPNDVSAELAQRWGTTSQNIRAIRSRAMKKLMSFIRGPQTSKEEVT
ncbi:MAG: sigma-70 family RNA polymerase sigma factor [Polyangiaceae bacterium]|nr:sigma-70 family RNA polymerase sigma factor [Polyangiaceae bacterium]